MILNWEDTKEVILDTTMLFDHGYDFFGMEHLREEAATPIGRFMVWIDHFNINGNHKYAFYGGNEGWHQSGFNSEEAAKDEVVKLVKLIEGIK